MKGMRDGYSWDEKVKIEFLDAIYFRIGTFYG